MRTGKFLTMKEQDELERLREELKTDLQEMKLEHTDPLHELEVLRFLKEIRDKDYQPKRSNINF